MTSVREKLATALDDHDDVVWILPPILELWNAAGLFCDIMRPSVYDYRDGDRVRFEEELKLCKILSGRIGMSVGDQVVV